MRATTRLIWLFLKDASARLGRQRGGALALGAAALFAAAGLGVLVLEASGSSGPAADAREKVPLAVPAVLNTRLVCSFANADARRAQIHGADGGYSVVVGGRTFWLFGDTLLLSASGRQIQQNALAWSGGRGPDGCPSLQYLARGGAATPILPKDGSLTDWPSGAWPLDDHTFAFYTVYVYGTGAYDYSIGQIGVARLDTRSMQTEVLARNLWDAKSGFPGQIIGAWPVEQGSDGLLRVVLQTKDGDELLARVTPASMADAEAYEYWDGDGWSRDRASAHPLWPHASESDPVRQLASFDNGASIAYNAYLHQYVAVQNIGFDKIGARVADRLEGPWSAPAVWIDCSAIAAAAVPVCYSPFQHPQISSADGRTIFLTFTRQASYDVVAYEITLGPATTGDQQQRGQER
jgi:hypothetical protein